MGVIIGGILVVVTVTVIVVWIDVFEMRGRSSQGVSQCINDKN